MSVLSKSSSRFVLVFSVAKFSMDLRLLWAMFVLFLLLLPFSAQDDSSRSVASCPENFQCGNRSLKFPFTNLKHYNCGGLCVVDCSNESFTRIALEYSVKQWFQAKSIENSTMTLIDPRLQSGLDNRSCLAFSYDLDILLRNSPSISFMILNSITLFTCNGKVNQTLNDLFHKSGYGYYGGCEGFTLYYKYPDSSPLIDPPVEEIGPRCSVNYLPKNKTFAQDNNSHVPEVFRLLGAEIDLQWNVSEHCYDCHNTGGVCQTEWSTGPHCVVNDEGRGKKKFGVILGLGAAGVGMVLLACFFICFYKFKSSSHESILMLRLKSRKDQNLETFIRQHESLAPKRYPYSDIKKMTNLFKDELGRGGFGTVYRGKLVDGHLVAVKILNVSNGNDEDFINEVLSISRTSHVNVVKLLGFCIHGERRALVYEYMPNGSLDKYIHDQKNNSKIYGQLGIDKLYQISLGVARGLEYLHRGCNTRILHFDIKPHNILLDEDFNPKISDFGLAKQCANKNSAVSILGARGTIGYIAPELISRCFGIVSYKSDVYSYGMMILEIVGQRKNVNVETSNASEIYFPHWAYQHLVVNKDLKMKGVLTLEEDEIAKKLILVGLWCIQNNPSHRPTMSKVIEMLEGSLQAIEVPPKPFFVSPSTSPEASFNPFSEITSALLTPQYVQNHLCSW